jgi:hypothetical protein
MNTTQERADKEVARLLGISAAHSILLRKINDGQPGAQSDVLTDPEKYIGPNYETVINFWWTMDSLTKDQWKEVARRLNALDSAAREAAYYAARSAAGYATWEAAWIAAKTAAGYAAGYATLELIGSIKNPVLLPLFDNLDTSETVTPLDALLK